MGTSITVYLTIVAVLYVAVAVAIIATADHPPATRKEAARLRLLAPIWPLALIVGGVVAFLHWAFTGVVGTVRDAFGKEVPDA